MSLLNSPFFLAFLAIVIVFTLLVLVAVAAE